MRSLIDSKFEQPATSGLTCDVKGSMKFDVKVSKPQQGFRRKAFFAFPLDPVLLFY